MTVEQLIRALQQMPAKHKVYATDDGTVHLPEWNAHVSDVSAKDGIVSLEFEGAWLRAAIEEAEDEEE